MATNSSKFSKNTYRILILLLAIAIVTVTLASSLPSADTSQESLPSASEDPSLRGDGVVGLLENLGNVEKGFAFNGADWFSSKEDFLSGLNAIWPDVSSSNLSTEYEDDSTGVYLTSGMAQFSDFASSAIFRITETNKEVTACSYVFSFDTSEKEDCLTAFLQAREMLTETYGGADEEIPAFNSELPSGGTWYGADGSGLGITDTSIEGENYQFEIALSAPHAQG